MNNPMPKAVFFDIDGTLVPYDTRRVSQEDRETIEALRGQGTLVFIVTGRHICDIDNIPFAVDGAVCCNGALTYAVKGNCAHFYERERFVLVEDHPIPKRKAVEIAGIIADNQIPASISTDTRTLFGNLTRKELEFIRRVNMPSPREGDVLETAINESVYSFNAFVSPEEEKILFNACIGRSRRNVLWGLDTFRWCDEYCDINVHGLDKVVGIKKILDIYRIGPADIIAFGDGFNDIAMLEFAGRGIAMETAADAVKSAADCVTASAADSGVSRYLKRLGLSVLL